jgi:hypothetical protein
MKTQLQLKTLAAIATLAKAGIEINYFSSMPSANSVYGKPVQ